MGLPIAIVSLITRTEPSARLGIALALMGLAVLAMSSHSIRGWLPERRCQVDTGIAMLHTREGAALRWGVVLGTGVCTFLVTPAFYGLVGVGLVSGFLPALIVFMAYGSVRGITIAVFALRTKQINSMGIEREPGGWIGPLLRIPLVVLLVLSSIAAATRSGATG